MGTNWREEEEEEEEAEEGRGRGKVKKKIISKVYVQWEIFNGGWVEGKGKRGRGGRRRLYGISFPIFHPSVARLLVRFWPTLSST